MKNFVRSTITSMFMLGAYFIPLSAFAQTVEAQGRYDYIDIVVETVFAGCFAENGRTSAALAACATKAFDVCVDQYFYVSCQTHVRSVVLKKVRNWDVEEDSDAALINQLLKSGLNNCGELGLIIQAEKRHYIPRELNSASYICALEAAVQAIYFYNILDQN